MKIAVLPGDGIGKEVTAQAVKALKAVWGNSQPLELQEAPIGEAGYEAAGDSLPPATLELARAADAILLGATGVVADERRPPSQAAGRSTLRLRKELGLYANYRPAFLLPELIGASTLKPEVVEGLNLLILRELNGGLYYGEPRGPGFNTMRYSPPEVERIGRAAFQAARRRRKKLCSVDKSNVLETSALWRETMTHVAREYPDVELSHLLVDAAAMMLVRNPKHFDVIVAANMFGDILSDEAAMLTGSIGMLPSASLGDGKKGLYEPVHGSAPDIAGKDLANPLAAILSVSMMLRYSFDMEQAAVRVEQAVRSVLRAGYRTADIFEPGTTRIGTEEMGERVAEAIQDAIQRAEVSAGRVM
ncbi:MAG TPA: 3-isopropylmalate dehydrogenase [Bryobacteraceae bacterium]|nr:3-isopropylmalate dehydrogenase [Bryobacteraceae bacterium]